MKIKEVSEKFGLTPDTLRYYERIGLIDKVQRNKNGIREYSEENCATIAFIKCMRAADVSIEGLSDYLRYYRQDGDTRDVRRKILLHEKGRLMEKMQHIQKALDRLEYKLKILDENDGKCCQKQ